MSWWPFKRKSKPLQDDLHIRGTRVWLQDLREACEMNFDNPEEGRRLVRQMQIEWTDSHSEGESMMHCVMDLTGAHYACYEPQMTSG